MLTQEEIYTKVSSTLVEALNVDEDQITPQATLQGDLGAESIDFLDIVFRLEREFGIKIPRGELFPESIFQGDPDFVQNGRVTDKGLECWLHGACFNLRTGEPSAPPAMTGVDVYAVHIEGDAVFVDPDTTLN